MSRKRKFDSTGNVRADSPNLKRARNYTTADAELAKIFDTLSSDDSTERLQAASTLVRKYSNAACKEAGGQADYLEYRQSLQHVLARLIRGLCSRRKAARHGYYVALTEIMRVNAGYIWLCQECVNLVKDHTKPNLGASNQDKRDHTLGRVAGYSAILHSEVLMQDGKPIDLSLIRLIDTLVDDMKLSSWVREEIAQLLVQAISVFAKDDRCIPFAEHLLQRVAVKQSLAHTPEGVAVWLQAREQIPNAKLPKHIWHHRDPLSKKEISNVAQIMQKHKNLSQGVDSTRTKSSTGERQDSPHFAWKIVLRHLAERNEEDNTFAQKDSSFTKFWTNALDDGYLNPTSPPEKKSLGLQIFLQLIKNGSSWTLGAALTPNLTSCLVNQNSEPQRYLSKSAKSTLDAIVERARRDGEAGLVLFDAIASSSPSFKFDKLTKSKTIQSILIFAEERALDSMLQTLCSCLRRLSTEVTRDPHGDFQIICDYLLRLVRSRRSTPEFSDTDMQPQWLATVLMIFAEISLTVPEGNPDVSESARGLCFSRLMSCLGHLLSSHSKTCSELPTFLAQVIHKTSSANLRLFQKPDDTSRNLVQHSIEKLARPSIDTGTFCAFRLLLSMTLIQALANEAGAISMLQELCDIDEDLEMDKGHKRAASNAIVDIVLDFASRPSISHRRLAEQVFGVFANDMGHEALQAMLDVLEQSETLTGQNSLFKQRTANEVENDDVNDLSGRDEDVEEVSVEGKSNEPQDEPDAKGSSSDSSEPDDDASSEASGSELHRFNEALASTLGTSNLNGNGGSATDDEDDVSMTDSQMMELEPHLTAIFKERAIQTPSADDTSSGKKKKKDTPKRRTAEAKQNMTNFKNRILDLLNLWLKQRPNDPLTVNVILPLIRGMRKTGNRQVAEKIAGTLRAYFETSKKKGLPLAHHDQDVANEECPRERPPACHTQGEINDQHGATKMKGLWEEMRGIHEEALLFPSRAHASTCSKASLFVARCLLTKQQIISQVKEGSRASARGEESQKADGVSYAAEKEEQGREVLEQIWSLYNQTGMGKLIKDSGLPSFFWNDWIEWVFAKKRHE